MAPLSGPVVGGTLQDLISTDLLLLQNPPALLKSDHNHHARLLTRSPPPSRNMSSPTSTQAFRNNVPGTKSFWPSHAGTPSPSTLTSSPPADCSPYPSSVKTPAKLPSLIQRRRSQIEATQHYPFADLNVEDCIMDQLSMASTPTVQRSTNSFSKIRRERSVSVIVSGAATTTAPDRGAPIAPPPAAYVAVTDANFKAHRHRHGDCLAHPSGCSCEKVQRPIMGQDEAWQVMSMRFKAVHRD